MACAGSTEPAGWPREPLFDSTSAYELDPDVSLRREPFGALAYHHGTRRLSFLRSGELVELVESLGQHRSAAAAIEATGLSSRRRSFERALSILEASEVIRAR